MRKPYVEQNGHLNASREDLEPGVKLFYRDRITLTARANKLSSKTPFSQKHKGAEDNEQLQVKQGEVHDSATSVPDFLQCAGVHWHSVGYVD